MKHGDMLITIQRRGYEPKQVMITEVSMMTAANPTGFLVQNIMNLTDDWKAIR